MSIKHDSQDVGPEFIECNNARGLNSRFSVLLLLALCFATSVAAQVAARAEPELKRVLLLYSGRSEFPAIRAVDTGLREAFAARGGVEVFAEFFDFARFPAAQHTGGLIALLRDRYGSRKLDMVITTGYEALQFALAQRAELFPSVPITYCHLEPHQLAGQTLPPDVTGVAVFHDFRRTIELALKLQPDVREAVCVFGTTELDRQVGQQALAALAKYPELQVRPMDKVPYAEIMEQVRHLPAESMVLYVNMQRDVAGQARLPTLVAEELSATSSVPVYGFVTHQLERGLLGGAMTDYEAHGREIGALAVTRLDGQMAAPRDAAASPLLINWRALKKWHVPESRVPEEAIVRFKPPSLWQEHRGMIIGIFVVVAMQSVLIAGLLLNRATRRRAEGALVESEERYREVVESQIELVCRYQADTTLTFVNEAFCRFFGKKREALIGSKLLDLIPPTTWNMVLDDIASLDKEHRARTHEREVILSDGSIGWQQWVNHAIVGPDGTVAEYQAIVHDISDRKHAEEARRQLAHAARVSTMGELAASMAHELNQPLGAILANTEAAELFLQQDPPVLDELRVILADIRKDDERAGEVIRRMRALLRKHELEREPLEIHSLVEDVLQLVSGDAALRGVSLSADLGPELPRISGDRVHLQQVLLNLILNGMDDMAGQPRERRQLLVRTRLGAEGLVELAVIDSGHGLELKKLHQLFEPFYTTKPNGMGMGLSIARTIIAAHHGRIWAENNPAGGAVFRIALPVILE